MCRSMLVVQHWCSGFETLIWINHLISVSTSSPFYTCLFCLSLLHKHDTTLHLTFNHPQILRTQSRRPPIPVFLLLYRMEFSKWKQASLPIPQSKHLRSTSSTGLLYKTKNPFFHELSWKLNENGVPGSSRGHNPLELSWKTGRAAEQMFYTVEVQNMWTTHFLSAFWHIPSWHIELKQWKWRATLHISLHLLCMFSMMKQFQSKKGFSPVQKIPGISLARVALQQH